MKHTILAAVVMLLFAACQAAKPRRMTLQEMQDEMIIDNMIQSELSRLARE